MKETWKDIPNYEGYYQISDIGRIKSISRYDKNNHFVKEKIRVLRSSTNGYLKCNLSKDGKTRTENVHILVAMAFFNYNPKKNKFIIDHRDNIKHNNNPKNLQLTTPRINTSKDRKNGSSGYVGVSWHLATKKWIANIWVGKKQKYLGVFDSEIEASNVYQKELKKIQDKELLESRVLQAASLLTV